MLHVEEMLAKEETTHKMRAMSLTAAALHFLKSHEVQLNAQDLAALCRGDMQARSQATILFFQSPLHSESIPLCSKNTRALTFQNLLQAALVMSQRSQLPLKIMDKLETLVNLVEMSRVTGVLMSGLIVHHQQYKVLSQLSRACKEQGFLIPGQKKSGAAAVAEISGKGFKGATVLDAHVGAHSSPICTLDFASLYPSIIIAHNLSYETLVRRNPREHPLMAQDPSCIDKLPYEKFSLDDEPTQVSGTASSFDQSYPGITRFWKRGAMGREEGILPSILRRLLAARKHTKELLKRETDAEMQLILHHRQLAYKVSCNAIYGYLGSNGVYALPCIPLAATITAIGRQLLQLTKDAVEDFFSVANGHHANASVIYGDTDSVMIDFKLDQAYCERQRTGYRCMAATCTSGGSRCWQIGEAMHLGSMAAKLVNASFLSSGWSPISLEFEKVHCPYLLFAKKHYAGLMYTHNPHQADKVDLKGMNTRNKCQFVEDTFNLCLHGLLYSDLSKAQVAKQVQFARQQVDLLTSGKVPMDQLVLGTSLSRAVGEYKNKNDHVQLVVRMEERGTNCYKVGSRVLHVRVINKEDTRSGVVEDPVVALEQGLCLDLLWYLEHQIKEPIKQLFSLVMPNCEAAIFGQRISNTVTKRFDSHNAPRCLRPRSNEGNGTTCRPTVRSVRLGRRGPGHARPNATGRGASGSPTSLEDLPGVHRRIRGAAQGCRHVRKLYLLYSLRPTHVHGGGGDLPESLGADIGLRRWACSRAQANGLRWSSAIPWSVNKLGAARNVQLSAHPWC